MVLLRLLFSIALLNLLLLLPARAEVITVPLNLEGPEEQYAYFVELLSLIVNKSADKYGEATLETITVPMNQSRQLRALQNDDVQVVWSMTSQEREAQYQAIYFPLTGGLFGYRVFLTLREAPAISGRVSLTALKNLILVQSQDWPDYGILRESGFNVNDADYKTGFTLVEKGMADAYPRSVLEVFDEMSDHPLLKIDNWNALYYPSPMYFFVAKNNTELAQRLAYGAKRAFEDGDAFRLISSRPFFQEARNALRKKKIVTIPSHQTEQSDMTVSHPFARQVQRAVLSK